MRTFRFLATIGVIVIFMVLTGQAMSDIAWDFGDYTFKVYQEPQNPKIEGKMTPFITASLEKNSRR